MDGEWGTLLIGVDDEGNAIGLQKDYSTRAKKDIDGFELQLRQLKNKYLGSNFEKYIKIIFEEVDEMEICLVKIANSGRPVFISHEGKDFFFLRSGSFSMPLDRQEQIEYEKLYWK